MLDIYFNIWYNIKYTKLVKGNHPRLKYLK